MAFLQDEEAILAHRGAALQLVQQQCGVSENIATMLMLRRNGDLEATCAAWQQNPTGQPVQCAISMHFKL